MNDQMEIGINLAVIGAALFVAFLLFGCSPVHVKTHNMTGGVKEPLYPPESNTNCWVQPTEDELWYPCQERSIH